MTRLVTFLDEETTGKLDKAHRIIELSLRICDLDSGEEKRNVLLRFDPKRNIDAKAFAVHGISIDELRGKPTIDVHLPEIIQILKDSELTVAHNGKGFDIPFLEYECERNGVEFPKFRLFDTMLESTFATDLGKLPSLKELCFALDVVYDPALAHSGDYDTEVLRDSFFNGLRYGWYKI